MIRWIIGRRPRCIIYIGRIRPTLGQEVPPVSEDSRQEACILQPTFQILVPPTVGYDRLWRLDQIAEFRRRDIFAEYRHGSGIWSGCHAGVDSGDDPWLD